MQEAGRRARDVESGTLEAKIGHARYLARVGVRPSGGGRAAAAGREGRRRADYALSEINFERQHAVVVIQAHVRGWMGRRKAAEELAQLQRAFNTALRQVEGAKVIQHVWRAHRQRSRAAALRQQEEDGPRLAIRRSPRARDVVGVSRPESVQSELFPVFSDLEPGKGTRTRMRVDTASHSTFGTRPVTQATSDEVVVKRLRMMEKMQIRLIWLTPRDSYAGGKVRRAKESRLNAIGKKETEMAFHFWRKNQPLVALRYLQTAMAIQQDSVAAAGGGGTKVSGVTAAEYAMAINSANTACVLAQVPLLKIAEALVLTRRAMETLRSHDEVAQLADKMSKAALRRLEYAVCQHNVTTLELASGVGVDTWQRLASMNVSVDEIVAQEPALASHAYTVGIHKGYSALQQVATSVAEGTSMATTPQRCNSNQRGAEGGAKQLMATKRYKLSKRSQTIPSVIRDRSSSSQGHYLSAQRPGRRRRRRPSEIEETERAGLIGHDRRARSAPLQELPQIQGLRRYYITSMSAVSSAMMADSR